MKGDKFGCESCEYKWVTRKDWGEPSVCPNCKSQNIFNYSNLIAEFEKEQEKKGLVEFEGKWIPKKEFEKIEKEKLDKYEQKQRSILKMVKASKKK